MAATRLTKALRDDIHHALMKRAFVERKEDLDRREHELADKIYNRAYDEKTQALMAQLGADFFPQLQSFIVRFGHDDDRVNMKTARPVSNNVDNYNRCRFLLVLEGDDPLTEEHRAWKKDKTAYTEERYKLSNEARGILEACSTVKRLCETWPEICPLLSALGIKQKSAPCLLPAVRKDMNKLFELPPRHCGNCNMTALGDGPVCPYEGEVTESYTCDKWEPIQSEE